MSTAGEAASLFVAADSEADPFASVVSNDGTTQAASTRHTHAQQSATASDLFNSAPESTDFFSPGELSSVTASNGSNGYGEHLTWDENGLRRHHDYDDAAAASSANSSSQYQTDGWYDQYSQASAYGLSEPQHPVYDPHIQGQPSSSYESYTPYTSASSSLSVPVLDSTQNTSQTYDPYKPGIKAAPQATPGNHASQTTSAQSSYDPYKPTHTTVPDGDGIQSQSHYSYVNGSSTLSNYSTSATAFPSASSTAFVTSAPPPRPKITNAYDPPLPPPKHSKHGHTWQPHHVPASGVQRFSTSQRPLSSPQVPPARSPEHSVSSTTQHKSYIPESYKHEAALSNGHVSSQRSDHGSQVLVPRPIGGDGSLAFGKNDGRTSSSPRDTSGVSYYDRSMTSQPISISTIEDGPVPLPPNQQAWPNPGHESVTFPQGFRSDVAALSTSPQRATSVGTAYDPYNTRSTSLCEVTPSPERARSPGRTAPTSMSAGETLPRPKVRNAYTPSTTSRSPERTVSPGNASIPPWAGIQRQATEERLSYTSSLITAPNTFSGAPSHSGHRASYGSRQLISAGSATSPSSVHSVTESLTPVHDPYALTSINMPSYPRDRSMSNGSTLSSTSAVADDPYAPSRHPRQQHSESSSQGSLSNYYDRAAVDRGVHVTTTHDHSGQAITLAPSTQTVYAPSPSLLGTNDPLGRTSVQVPVVSFGFGGKLVVCFHGTSTLNTGFDVALSSRQSTDIKIYVLHSIIPDSALDTSTAFYPGPLFSDPGTPSTSLVRTGAAAQTKTKKVRVKKYLEERAEEISRGIGYLHHGSLDGKRAEAKHILVKLLKVMIDNDGRLSGSPQIDAAVRAALVPRLVKSFSDTLETTSSLSIASNTDVHTALSDVPSTPYLGLHSSGSDPNDSPIAVHTLRSSNLDTIHEFLLRGDRRAACHYASDEKLWAHAMVIASSIDKDIWKEVVSEFVRTELATKDSKNIRPSREADEETSPDGREALRVAYSLFAGQGSASVRELVPPQPLTQGQTLQLPQSSVLSITPMSASFPGPAEAMHIPIQTLARWADTAAMIFSNPMTLESSSALTALGDQLALNQWFEAAHACYLLSPQTSPMGGVGSSSRVVLLGSPGPHISPGSLKDPDPIIFSEIAEFALSLATPAKGQEAFLGLPYLQPYRLIRAAYLAEIGHVQLSHRYCEAISNCSSRNSPYTNSTFVEQLKGLTDRLVAAPQIDKSGSWIGSKMTKPSLDSIGNWLEGRLTKFIAGETDSSRAEDAAVKTAHQHVPSDPFAHYSAISSTTSSPILSPQHSKMDLADMPNSPPPFRTGSAMALRSSAGPQVVINRSSSAMDYNRPLGRKASPLPRVSSASAATNTFADASLYSQALNGHAFGSSSKQNLNDLNLNDDRSQAYGSSKDHSSGAVAGVFWGSSDSGAPTPTASSFVRLDEGVPAASSSGFISLMDDPTYSITPTATQGPASSDSHRSTQLWDDDEDDLGLGNTSHRTERVESSEERSAQSTPAKEKLHKETAQPQATEKPGM
ncbi:hypothetical protein AcV7_008992 [Taiwanofungus camphoratus]|nr:hypothetical protein AcV7_008992 [Antrodia cinnamomea]